MAANRAAYEAAEQAARSLRENDDEAARNSHSAKVAAAQTEWNNAQTTLTGAARDAAYDTYLAELADAQRVYERQRSANGQQYEHTVAAAERLRSERNADAQLAYTKAVNASQKTLDDQLAELQQWETAREINTGEAQGSAETQSDEHERQFLNDIEPLIMARVVAVADAGL